MSSTPLPPSHQRVVFVDMHQQQAPRSSSRAGASAKKRPYTPAATTTINNDGDDDAVVPHHPNDDDDDDDDLDGGSQSGEILKRLLSPESALFAQLAGEIVSQLASAERSKDLASMSRPRYVATQCITLIVALLAVSAVVVIAVSNNSEVFLRFMSQALNATLTPSLCDTPAATIEDAPASHQQLVEDSSTDQP